MNWNTGPYKWNNGPEVRACILVKITSREICFVSLN